MKHYNSKVTVYHDGKVVGYQHSNGEWIDKKPNQEDYNCPVFQIPLLLGECWVKV